MSEQLKIARILYPVKTLGPGNRLAIWLAGCDRGCEGCANPELWDASNSKSVGLDIIKRAISETQKENYPPLDGVTITGGEPFLQPEALKLLVDYLNEVTRDILVYSGNERKDLKEYEKSILSKIAVLIDGAYKQSQNQEHPLKGSANQVIHYLRPEYQSSYEAYICEMSDKRNTQMFELLEGRVAAGIHAADFEKEYQKRLAGKKHEWTKM